MDKIKTERLTIRPYRKADGDFVVSALNNLDLSRWLISVPHPFTHADLKLFGPKGESRWPDLAAIDAPEGQAGAISFGSKLGFWLHPNAHGKGYGSEAAKAAVDHSFNHLNVDAIEAGYLVGNTASAKILAKLGFELLRQDEAHCQALGRKMPACGLELSRATWELHQ